jgi:hypothetical protein
VKTSESESSFDSSHFLNRISQLSVCLKQISHCIHWMNKTLGCSIHFLLILLEIQIHSSPFLGAQLGELLDLCWCTSTIIFASRGHNRSCLVLSLKRLLILNRNRIIWKN